VECEVLSCCRWVYHAVQWWDFPENGSDHFDFIKADDFLISWIIINTPVIKIYKLVWNISQ
jgi:hypothetical protein